MKIITWNCNQNFSRKASLVEFEDADILIIQECERLPNNFFPGYELFWCGYNEKKGLAVIVRDIFTPNVSESVKEFAYFLPVRTKFGLIIGVWAFNSRASKFGSNVTGHIVDFLDHIDADISNSLRVIIAGDFNNGPRWEKIKFHRNNFRYILSQLETRGFRSSYHTFHREKLGEETKFTHFHQREVEKKFHIDYAFTKGLTVTSVRVGAPEDWIDFSDHTPLIIELSS